MTFSVGSGRARAQDVRCTADELVVELTDGRTVITPLAWYPRLLHATKAQRNHWRLLGRGIGINWPDVDEDLSVDGMLAGTPSLESAESLARAGVPVMKEGRPPRRRGISRVPSRTRRA
jgi:Protein of unknown function (DUF2442)